MNPRRRAAREDRSEERARTGTRGSRAVSQRIVALGGGHGLYATLSAARRLTPHVTAVVTVADDGGSSGRLRSELDVVPPGDLRMALAALASDSPHGRLWADHHPAPVRRQRSAGGSPDRQPVAGRPQRGACRPGRRARRGGPDAGRQGPGAADVSDRAADRGRCRRAGVGSSDGPRDPRAGGDRHHARQGAPGAVAAGQPAGDPAGRRRDHGAQTSWCSGPGSWFTSVIPHVLVPGLAAALRADRGARALVLNLVAEPGETAGFSAERHLHVLAQHAPGSPCTTSSSTRAGCRGSASAISCGGPRPSSMPKSSLLTCPDLVHLYMTRRSWRQRWTACVCREWSPRHRRCRRRLQASRDRVAIDREVTIRGDDGRGQGRAEPGGGSKSVSARRAEVAALLRFAGGLHIVSGRVVVEAEVDTGVIARRLRKDIFELYGYNARGARAGRRRSPQGHPLRRAGGQGRRGAGPPDRAARPARPTGARAAAHRSSAAASATPRRHGAARFWRTDR